MRRCLASSTVHGKGSHEARVGDEGSARRGGTGGEWEPNVQNMEQFSCSASSHTLDLRTDVGQSRRHILFRTILRHRGEKTQTCDVCASSLWNEDGAPALTPPAAGVAADSATRSPIDRNTAGTKTTIAQCFKDNCAVFPSMLRCGSTVLWAPGNRC